MKQMTKDDLDRLMAEHLELNPDRPIREDIKEALDRYASHGHGLGGFLTAVVENNLFKAMGSADSYNRATLFQIVDYIYNELPASCWGSREKVNAHYDKFKGGV